eukprot:8060223-Pyramimonas_sp.AAC.1
MIVRMKPFVSVPGELIAMQGEVAMEMFLLLKGSVKVNIPAEYSSPRPITLAYPQNVPLPDQSRRRTRRRFLAPTNHVDIPAEYSSPRPLTPAYPQNSPRPDQSRRRTRRMFLDPTNHAVVPAECSSPRPVTPAYPPNNPRPD